MKPIAVLATGMMTGVGLDAPSTCAAIRCAVDNFQETRFVSRGGDWIIGSEVPLDPPVRGRPKLVRMAAAAIRECLGTLGTVSARQVPLLLCVSEPSRPGRPSDLDRSLIADIERELEVKFAETSEVLANGNVGGVQAIEIAMRRLNEQSAPRVLVAGTDSLLVAGTLEALDRKFRLLTPNNSNGLIPGEGAAAVLLGLAEPDGRQAQFVLRGVGYGCEAATIESEEPLKGDGLMAAIQQALAASGGTYDDVDYRITDISGEQYAFKEATLAAARSIKKVKEEYDLWHTADCIGDIGAAIAPTMIAVAKAAAEKNYAKGDGVLFHCANDDSQRAAAVGRYLHPEPDHG